VSTGFDGCDFDRQELLEELRVRALVSHRRVELAGQRFGGSIELQVGEMAAVTTQSDDR
jgi:hypothetical protein